jgi:hypothetical protein
MLLRVNVFNDSQNHQGVDSSLYLHALMYLRRAYKTTPFIRFDDARKPSLQELVCYSNACCVLQAPEGCSMCY